MPMTRKRFKLLIFLDKIFPPLEDGTYVWVSDKRYKLKGYPGQIITFQWVDFSSSFREYLVLNLKTRRESYVFRDNLEPMTLFELGVKINKLTRERFNGKK